MKKNLFTLGLIALATLTLTTNCAKSEIEVTVEDEKNIEAEGIPFELSLITVDTKTTNDGMATAWENTDDIILFHAVNGTTTYVKDGQFTVKDAATGIFQGTLNGSLDGETSYDWYALYPYFASINTPANTSSGFTTVAPISSQTQTGNDSKAHLVNLPLAGKATTAAGVSKPAISMYQLAGVIKVVVTNNSGADLPVTSVKITTQADKTLDGHTDIYISGSYYINFTNPASAVYTAADSKSTSVTLNAGYLIPSLGTGTFYVAVKPFSVPVGDKLKVKVNNYEKTITVSGSTKNFPAGEISKINFNYDEAASIATLPFSIDGSGGSSAYSSTDGLSAYGLGTDYSSSTHGKYITKFDNDGDYFQVRFDAAAGKASIGVKMIGGNTSSSFDVKGSVDGITFTQIENLAISGAQNSTHTLETTADIDPSYRYLRFVFNKGANVGVGAVSITKPSTAPAIVASNVTGVVVTGVTSTFTYTPQNFSGADDVEVSSVDGTVVKSASVTSAGTVTYTVNPNYTTGPVNGSITLHSDSESVNKVITVSQLGETFSWTGSSTITLTKDDDSYQDITITTASFGWNTTITPEAGMNLTASPSSDDESADAQTIRISSSTKASASEQTLGTIVIYRNGNSSDPQKKTITVKKAGASAKKYTKVDSFTSGKTYIIVSDNHVMTRPGSLGSTLPKLDVTVTSNQITQTNDTKACEFTISTSTIESTTCYLITWVESEETRYVSMKESGTAIKYVTAEPTSKTGSATWTIATTTTRGSFTIMSNQYNTRYIRYRAGSTTKFGAYTSETGEYYNVDLYQLED